jgi:hypothetical protein
MSDTEERRLYDELPCLLQEETGPGARDGTRDSFDSSVGIEVVHTALENAVSVAGVLLLTEATLTEVPDPKKEHARSHEMSMAE